MTVTKTGLAPDPLRYILANLREEDRDELFATRSHQNVDRAVFEMMQYAAPHGTMFWYDGEPVSCLGFVPLWPGVVNVWAYGTELWPKVVLSMTKHVRQETIPELLANGTHRAECRSLAKRRDSERWLQMLGARAEHIITEWGRNREDFTVFAWSDHDIQHHAHLVRH